MGPIWGRQDPGGTHVGPIVISAARVASLGARASAGAVKTNFCPRYTPELKAQYMYLARTLNDQMSPIKSTNL